MRLKAFCFIIIALIAISSGCSKGADVTTPDPLSTQGMKLGHQVWGAYDIIYDGVSDTLDFVQSRNAAFHLNVTPYFVPDHVSLVVTGYDPVTKVFTVDITIDNPFPVNGYDVRGIVDNLGTGDLLNPDDYTKLYDTGLPPVPNPFRAYAKDDAQRILYSKFSMPFMHIKTETYQLYLPGPITATLVLDASWPTNCDEPYDFTSFYATGDIIESSGSIDVTLTVLDWQDVTASDVVLEANPVTVGDLHFTQVGDSTWHATLSNTGGAAPGDYVVWIAAHDAVANNALYYRYTITVNNGPGGDEPILVAGNHGINETLPRIVYRDNDMWIIYTDGGSALAKVSTDGGLIWSEPMTIGAYSDIDTLHAVEGQDNSIYVQYQTSYHNETYHTAYQGGTWLTPESNDMHGLTLVPYSCDLGLNHNGYIFDMAADDWSMYGFHSNFPYDETEWTVDWIESFYNCVYSINDGFVQNVGTPKIFYIHDLTSLEYGAWDGTLWNRGAVVTGDNRIIEPAVAPESDDPYHLVAGVENDGRYDLEYVQFASWPPTYVTSTVLASDLAEEPVFHSISVEGDHVAILYIADGEVRYVESTDGGFTFSPYEVLGGGGGGRCDYSHIRQNPYGPGTACAYAKEEGGDYNIYVEFK